MSVIEAALHEALGPIHGFRPVAGGDTNHAAVFEAGGQRLFVKHNPHDLPGQFQSEALGLRAMAASGTSLVVPEVVHVADGFLVLEFLEPGPRPTSEAIGVGLAELHRATDARGFGFEVDGTCGATPQPNPWHHDWVTFYVEQRLRPLLVRLGLPTGFLERAPDVLADDEGPALIHGDLWFGNLYASVRGPALVDPAAYYAHREAELGMMKLFGGFGDAVYTAYSQAWPLRGGWEDRVIWYSLYHVLNHALLFPGGYRAQAESMIRKLSQPQRG